MIDFPNIDPIAFSIGPFAVRWYALAYIAGLVFAIWYAKRLVANRALWADRTPTITPSQRDAALRLRREGAQLRRRW